MHEIYELKEKLMEELKEYGRKGELSTGSLEVVDKLTHTIKNLCKIIEDSEMEEGGYSGMYYPYSREGDNRGGTQGGRSYVRGRGRNARRDSMGRYSSRGYSYADDDMVEQLTDLMEDAPEPIKKDIQKLITKVEQM